MRTRKIAVAADLSDEKETFLVEGGLVCEEQRETLGGVIRVHFYQAFLTTLGIDTHRLIEAHT